jgi:ABC-type sugar transport system ATPase subunit
MLATPNAAMTSDVASGAIPLVKTADLAKSFGPTQALRACSFELLPGEVHAIIGENGSGKSTLVKILAGVHRPDSGGIRLPGGVDRSPDSPGEAHGLGIAPVFQEVLVVGPRSVLDNVWLGTEGLLRTTVSAAEKRRLAAELLEQLLGNVPPLDLPVELMSLSDRQAVAIVRALARRPQVLILDEATSALDVATRDRLFAILARLAGDGTGVIFISHRMDEIEEIGDRITVMRSGETVATVGRGAATMRELVRLMTGADHLTGDAGARAERHEPGREVVRVRALRLRHGAAPIDFDLRAGELVGLAGLEGHGQGEFLHALRGRGGFSGDIDAVGDRQVRIGGVRDAAAQGIVYVPRERRDEALFQSLPIRGNFAVPTILEDARLGLVSRRHTEQRFRHWVDRLGIKLGKTTDDIATLSGGNQQKVVLARWLAARPRVLLLNDPTRGVDIGAKHDIYDLLVELSQEGIAVVMLSTEVDEHVELMDRVLVFRDYEVYTELPRARVTRERLVHAFFGRSDGEDGAAT